MGQASRRAQAGVRRLSACTGALALLGCLSAASAAAAPAITEFNGLTTNAEPLSITGGSEAAVWFGQHNSVGALDSMSLPAGAISSHATINGAPVMAVTRGPEGNIWFSESGGNAKLGMLNPASGIIVEYPQTTGAKITSMTSGPEGDIWYADENGAQSAIGRVIPATGAITEFSFHADRKPAGITVGREGDLWVTLSGGPAAIVRLSIATKAMQEFPVSTQGSAPTGIATGPEGDIWFTDMGGPTGAVGRLAPTSGQVNEFSAGLTRGKPQAIALGSDENMYVTESGSLGAIAQVTPQGTIHELTEGLTPKSEPWAIAAGPDGNVYFTERAKPARIGRIAIATGHTVSGQPSGGPTPSSPPLTEAQLAAEAELGTLAGVTPISGTVLVRNAAGDLVRLAGPRVLPLGTVIDTTSGVVRLITALNTHGTTQAVTVWGGIFKITQSKHGNGLTHIHLTGVLPRCPKGKAARAAATHGSHKSRKLWAKDNHGRYSTHGANSVATVLGTQWETTDSCAGTRTRVLKGKVKVRDLHRHRTVLVRAGHSYLARR